MAMLNKIKKILLISAFSFLIISSTTAWAWHDYYGGYGDWNYHGSGRDHAYSAYIDRANYVGPADYAPINTDYIDGPLVLTNVPVTPIAPPVILPPAPSEQYIVNIPNARGGFNSVVITKSGDGFVGPKGEYYPEFPKIFQLQMKYGD